MLSLDLPNLPMPVSCRVYAGPLRGAGPPPQVAEGDHKSVLFIQVARIGKTVESWPFGFERLYCGWVGQTVDRDAKQVVIKSADHYVGILSGHLEKRLFLNIRFAHSLHSRCAHCALLQAAAHRAGQPLKQECLSCPSGFSPGLGASETDRSHGS